MRGGWLGLQAGWMWLVRCWRSRGCVAWRVNIGGIVDTVCPPLPRVGERGQGVAAWAGAAWFGGALVCARGVGGVNGLVWSGVRAFVRAHFTWVVKPFQVWLFYFERII